MTLNALTFLAFIWWANIEGLLLYESDPEEKDNLKINDSDNDRQQDISDSENDVHNSSEPQFLESSLPRII